VRAPTRTFGRPAGRDYRCASERLVVGPDGSRPATRDRGRTAVRSQQEGAVTGRSREMAKVRERLTRIQDEVRRIRATERVLAEQVAYLEEVADDAETRRLVARTPLADREAQEARTDRDRHARLLHEARREVADLLAEQDRLLERLLELEGST
jgi:hypothetical protein